MLIFRKDFSDFFVAKAFEHKEVRVGSEPQYCRFSHNNVKRTTEFSNVSVLSCLLSDSAS